MALACVGGESVCSSSDLALRDLIWWSPQKSDRHPRELVGV
jgi:hypothetical protein